MTAIGDRGQRRLWAGLALGAALVVGLTLVVASPAAATTGPRIEGLPYGRLAPGDEGAPVIHLQQALAQAGFYQGAVDGVYGRETEAAVVAFHKYLERPRTATFEALDWLRLDELPDPGLPHRWDQEDYVEIDLARQLLFLFREGELRAILPVSTGGGYIYWSARNGRYVRAATPRGTFALKWNQVGWSCDRVTGWCVYKYWAFTDFYGIHGYNSVPAYPASHGCVRLHVWDADWIEAHLFVGMPVHIWDSPPQVPPPLTETPVEVRAPTDPL